VTNVPIFCAASWRENNVTGAQCYVNGAASGASVSSVGKTSWSMTDKPFALRMGSGSCYLVFCVGFIKKWLTAAEHATLYDEIVNQIRYETQSMIVNSTFPTLGGDVYRACYGLLAGEKTMSAGQSLGQLDALKVVSGTHKCSTELYSGQLAKTVVCVTNGTVRLPDPRPTLGTTFSFMKYSGGAWASATSASTDIALTAGEKLLWATADGNVAVRKY
jgi:hypothetical protein